MDIEVARRNLRDLRARIDKNQALLVGRRRRKKNSRLPVDDWSSSDETSPSSGAEVKIEMEDGDDSESFLRRQPREKKVLKSSSSHPKKRPRQKKRPKTAAAVSTSSKSLHASGISAKKDVTRNPSQVAITTLKNELRRLRGEVRSGRSRIVGEIGSWKDDVLNKTRGIEVKLEEQQNSLKQQRKSLRTLRHDVGEHKAGASTTEISRRLSDDLEDDIVGSLHQELRDIRGRDSRRSAAQGAVVKKLREIEASLRVGGEREAEWLKVLNDTKRKSEKISRHVVKSEQCIEEAASRIASMEGRLQEQCNHTDNVIDRLLGVEKSVNDAKREREVLSERVDLEERRMDRVLERVKRIEHGQTKLVDVIDSIRKEFRLSIPRVKRSKRSRSRSSSHSGRSRSGSERSVKERKKVTEDELIVEDVEERKKAPSKPPARSTLFEKYRNLKDAYSRVYGHKK